MSLYRSVRAVAGASGDGIVDWDAVARAAKASTGPGSIDLEDDERAGYATDVRDARDRVGEVAGFSFALPETIEIHHRHHWVDANVGTFRRVMAPIENQSTILPGVSRRLNTGSASVALAFLARNVLGQYDPILLAEEPDPDHGLYFVRPNIVRVAESLDVEYDRFRRWIAFHEVTHAAEFARAPWLSGYLEEEMQTALDGLSEGQFDRSVLSELDRTMTVVEGYAELLMDRAFDDEYADLREKVEARRRGRGPVSRAFRRLFGIGLKRRQYERGREFFESVAEQRGVEAAAAVWEGPGSLPSSEEIDDPAAWVARVDP